MDSTIPLHVLSKSKISSLLPYSVLVQPSLCRACLETTLLVFPRGGSLIQLDHSTRKLVALGPDCLSFLFNEEGYCFVFVCFVLFCFLVTPINQFLIILWRLHSGVFAG